MLFRHSLSLTSPAVFSVVLLALVLAVFAQSGDGEQQHSAVSPAVSPQDVGVPRSPVQATPPAGRECPFRASSAA